MRDRDRTLASALRSTLAALENAEAVDLPVTVTDASEHVAGGAAGIGAGEAVRRELGPEMERAIVAAEVQDLRVEAGHQAAAGRTAERDATMRAAGQLEGLVGLGDDA
jgi:hypothetical protein